MALNPYATIRTLRADLAEALRANADHVNAGKLSMARADKLKADCKELADENCILRLENERLGNLVKRAVFRDPDTGRLLPKGTY